MTCRFSRSTTVWNASAPATRVTGSKSTRRMWPLRASSSFTFSGSSSIGVTSRTSYEYGSATPSFRCALPCSSNSMGRFLKHMLGSALLHFRAFLGHRVGGVVALDRLVHVAALRQDVEALRNRLVLPALPVV